MNKDFAVDASIGSVAMSTPIWLQNVEASLQLFTLTAGAILLVFRIILAVKEMKEKKDVQSK